MEMTVKEVLKDVQKVLGDINVPATQIESIGVPIARALNGLKVCVEAIDNAEAAQAKEGDDENGIDLGEIGDSDA